MWAITRYLMLGRIVGSRGHLYVLAALGLLLGLGLTAGSALAGRLGEGAVAPSNPIGTMPGVLAHAANASKDGPTATPTNTPSPTSTPDCGLSWRLVPGPNLASAPHRVNGVAAVASNDVWAVGSYSIGSLKQTLVTHWDGTHWSTVSSPNVLTYTNELLSVEAVSSTDIWAVGSYYDASYYNSSRTALIEHWDGTQWSVFEDDRPGSYNDIAAVSANDIWIVGSRCDVSGCQSLAVHWDGSTLSEVPTPACLTFPFSSALNGISALSSKDIWAVGYCGQDTLTEHWDGTQWTIVPSGFFGKLGKVKAVSSNDVWALRDFHEEAGPQAPANYGGIVHWDGSQWSDSLGNAGDGSLNGIAATSANDVWVVGSIGKSRHTWAEHWDGTQWNYTELPSLRTCYFDSRNGLNDVAILSDGDIWAVGSMNDTYAGDREQGLFMHYSTCPNPVSTLVGHVEWQGRPIQPNLLQQLPITLTLQSDTTQVDYLALSTDATGIFAVPIGSVPEGLYTWRVKGPQYLAQTGTVLLTSAAVTNIDVGLMLTGDCNGDDVVAATDFSIFRRTFGKGLGDPGYDTRADFTGNNVVDVVDFNLLKSNFDLAGAPPITCE